jgi:penicillin-binding protein 1A
VVFWNNDGTPYMPENYIGEWRGPTRVRYALATSMNVVSLKVLNDIGFTDALNNAGRLLGLNETEMAERGFGPRYPVGLGTVSLSPLLMARAFAVFPNGGREVIPISVRFIEDRRGNEILNPAREVNELLVRKGDDAQILSPQAAYIMTSMLSSTVEYGTLAGRRWLVGGFGDMAMAGKTGTTDNWSDAWTVGFSPYMTTAVWLGFDQGGNNSLGTNQTGARTAGPIWAWYMKEIHETLPPREFERPHGIVDVTITTETGKLPTEDYRGATMEEIFIIGTEPTEFDELEDFHDEQVVRVTSEYAQTSSGGDSIADRLRELGLLDAPIHTTGDSGTTGVSGSGNPFLDDDSPDQDDSAESPDAEGQRPDAQTDQAGDETGQSDGSADGAGSNGADSEEDKPNPMLD